MRVGLKNCRFTLRTLFVALTLATVAIVGLLRYLDGALPIQWQRFSPEAVREANAAGHDVFVSFMADWDISTAVQHGLVDTPPVRRLLRQRRMTPMVADWSNGDPVIGATLNSLGRNSIPLLVVYPSSGKAPVVLGDGLLLSQHVTARLNAIR